MEGAEVRLNMEMKSNVLHGPGALLRITDFSFNDHHHATRVERSQGSEAAACLPHTGIQTRWFEHTGLYAHGKPGI